MKTAVRRETTGLRRTIGHHPEWRLALMASCLVLACSSSPDKGKSHAAGGQAAGQYAGGAGVSGAGDTTPGQAGAGGTPGSNSAGDASQGGDVSARAGAAAAGYAGSIAGEAGAAGAAGAPAVLSLGDVIAQFCALKDVLDCTPNCQKARSSESNYFRQCQELFRSLMLCQLALPAELRICESTTVLTPSRCIDEDLAYKACLGIGPS